MESWNTYRNMKIEIFFFSHFIVPSSIYVKVPSAILIHDCISLSWALLQTWL